MRFVKQYENFRAYMLEVQVQQHKVYGLLDTGAFRSFLDAELFKCIQERYPEIIKSCIRVQPIDVGLAVSKKVFRADTSVIFMCRLGTVEFEFTAMLMQGLTNGLIIGRDFFQLHVKSIHLESKELEMKKTGTTEDSTNIPYLSCISIRTELRNGREDSFEEVEQYQGGLKILIEKKPESEIDQLLCGLTVTEENELKQLVAGFKDIFSEEEKIGTCTKYVHQFKVKENF